MVARSFLVSFTTAATCYASQVKLPRQNTNTTLGGYDFVDPLIGTRNGGQSPTDTYLTWKNCLPEQYRPCLRWGNVAFR